MKKDKMIKNDYTHISVILDRTGSMEEIRDDTIGGFNAFLGEQKAQKGKATLTFPDVALRRVALFSNF